MALNEESRLLSMRILQNFVREKKGKWNQDDWSKLIQRVRKAGFEKIDEARIGKLLENNRERWLAGDNSVGPPPPGAGPAAKKPEAPLKTEKAAEKEVGKEKPVMPEQPKREAPRPQPTKEAARPQPTQEAPRPQQATSRSQAPTISTREGKVTDSEAQERHQRRIALIKSSQDLAKEMMDTEVEIRKQENIQVELQRKLAGLVAQRSPLEVQRNSLQQDVDGLTKEISQLQKQIEEMTVNRANLEGSVGNRKKARSEHVANIVRLKSEREALIT